MEVNNSSEKEQELNQSKTVKCWCCNSLVLKKRIENHHPIGKKFDKILPLCLICHDIVDRISMTDPDLMLELWINVSKDLEKLGTEYKWLKLFILKVAKVIKVNLDEISI